MLEKLAIYFSLFTSLLVMLGWYFGFGEILNIIPGNPTMKFNTALILFLIALNLEISDKKNQFSIILYWGLTSFTILVGLLSLIQYLDLKPFDLDNLFLKDTLSNNRYPGRMSPASALCCLLMGIGFLGLNSTNPKINVLSRLATTIVIILSLIALIAYFLLIQPQNKTHFFKSMAIHTSVLFMIMAISLLFKNSKSEFREILLSKFEGSKLMRKLIPVIVLFPLVLCSLLILGIDLKFLSAEFGLVTFAVIFIPAGLLYVAFIAKGFNDTDIKRLHLEERLKQFKKGLDQASIVAITDKRGVIKYVNDKFCHISKYSREELLGNTHSIVNSGHHSKAFFRHMWKTISSGKIWMDEIKNKAKDGSFYWVDTAIIPFKDEQGNIIEYMAIRQDISNLKIALENLNTQLIKNEQKNKEIENFVYIASHDLKSPLNSVKQIFNHVLKNYSLEENVGKCMEIALRSIERLRDLVTSLLDYSITDQQYLLEEVNINQILEAVKSDLKSLMDETRADLYFKEMPTIPVYKVPFRQLIQNLVANGMKYHRKDITPKISISFTEQCDHYEFRVCDNGIGIEQCDFNKIFVPFSRLSNGTDTDGNGLGLANCKRIVELHGGKIWLESKVNQGSTFLFTLKKSVENQN